MDDADQKLVRETFRLALLSRERGNRPFGALVADAAGMVLAAVHDGVVTGKDPLAHAEINVIRAVRGGHDRSLLRRCTLYASAEPCAMCAGAIFFAGIGRVVFGMSMTRLHEMMGRGGGDEGRLTVPCRGVFACARPLVEVVGPVFQAEAQECHRGYWQVG